MRLEKTCACGARVEVVYNAPKSDYGRGHGDARERQDALDQVKAWDRAHKGHGDPKLAAEQP